MTVLLVGVGADGEHLRSAPKLDGKNRYEYIPIPETRVSSESRTYGTLELRFADRKADQIIDRIRPKGKDGDWITSQKRIQDHPIHYDSDFDAASFGDRRGGVGTTLVDKLQSGDILGFS